MNNSQTLLLRFKNNIRSAYTPAIPEDMEHEFSANKSRVICFWCQSMAIDEVHDHLSVIID